MPVVLMATMWLLLVKTVNSTGQWYFPGEEAHTQGQRAKVREPRSESGRGGILRQHN